MLARVQLSVVVALALAACAGARPDGPAAKRSYSPNSYSATKGVGRSVIANAVQPIAQAEHDNVVHFPTDAPSKDVPQQFPNVQANAVGRPDGPGISRSADQVTIPQLFRDAVTPVNRRYPSAVLFGGTCGGTIIHPKWVLSAGHCSLHDSSTLFTGGRYVLAGTNNTDDGTGVSKKVKKLYVHPLFSVGPYWLNAKKYDIKQVAARWDFLLAELEEPFELSDTIKVAPLNEVEDLPPFTYTGYAGYGTDRHGGYMRSEMHAMHLQIQPEDQCATLEQFRSKDMLCAKGYKPNFDSACNGDSGSGLVLADGKLAGVASWVQNDAFECANGNIVVFSKVASARDWIRKVTGV